MPAEIPQQDGADGDTHAPATRDQHVKRHESALVDDFTCLARVRDHGRFVGTAWHLNVPLSAQQGEDRGPESRCTQTYSLRDHMQPTHSLKYRSHVPFVCEMGIPQVDGADDQPLTRPDNNKSTKEDQEEDEDEEEDVVRRKKRRKQAPSTSQESEQDNEASSTKNNSRLRLRMLESSESDEDGTMKRGCDGQAATHEDERVSYASLLESSSASTTLATHSKGGKPVSKKPRGDEEGAAKRKAAAKKNTANQEGQAEVVVGEAEGDESAQKTNDEGPKRKRAPKKATGGQEASARTGNHFDDVPAPNDPKTMPKNPAKRKGAANAQEAASASGLVAGAAAGKSLGGPADDTERYTLLV
jgi:hypothetical protein